MKNLRFEFSSRNFKTRIYLRETPLYNNIFMQEEAYIKPFDRAFLREKRVDSPSEK